MTRPFPLTSRRFALAATGFTTILLLTLPARSAPPDSEAKHRAAGEIKIITFQPPKDGVPQPPKIVWHKPTPEEKALSDALLLKRRQISDLFAAKKYKQVLTLLAAETDRDPGAEYRYGSDRLRAIAHVNFPDFKQRVRLSLANTKGSTSTYLTYCQILADDKTFAPDVYRFGRELVDEAVQKKQMDFWLLRLGAQMDANRGDWKSAVQTQTAAIAAADADPRCPPNFRQSLRDTLTKLQAEAAK